VRGSGYEESIGVKRIECEEGRDVKRVEMSRE
jgi:hypothetical protein